MWVTDVSLGLAIRHVYNYELFFLKALCPKHFTNELAITSIRSHSRWCGQLVCVAVAGHLVGHVETLHVGDDHSARGHSDLSTLAIQINHSINT